MFALHQPRPRCVASQESTHDVNNGSPKSPGISRERPAVSGQVMTIVTVRKNSSAPPERIARRRPCGSRRRSSITVADYSDRMSLRMFGITVAVVTLLGSASPRAFRAPQVGARSIGGLLDTLDRVRAVRETAISPDGRRVAWVEDVSAGAQTSAIQVRTIGAAAGDVRRVTASAVGGGKWYRGTARASCI